MQIDDNPPQPDTGLLDDRLAGAADFGRFVGFWLRLDDGSPMGEIRRSGVLRWSANFSAVETRLRHESEGGLGMDLNGELYSANLEPLSETDEDGAAVQPSGNVVLRWSDGERWVRGFLPFQGRWICNVDVGGDQTADILADGRLVWGSAFAAPDSRLQFRPPNFVELELGGAAHTGVLAPGPGGPGSGPVLQWSDGEMWVRPHAI